jgi:hypothetical protein
MTGLIRVHEEREKQQQSDSRNNQVPSGFHIHANRLEQRNDFLQAPNVIRDSRFHRGRDAERLMDASEIVIQLGIASKIRRGSALRFDVVG